MSQPQSATREGAGYSVTWRLTLGYLLALSIVAILTVTSHLILQHALRTHDGSAAVINLSGRQRMLSQRIASLSAQYALGDATAHAPLAAAVTQFETAHTHLILGDLAHGLPPAAQSTTLREIYFGGPDPLDTEVRRYDEEAIAILALPSADPRLRPHLAALFGQAEGPLLTGLEAVVMDHQRSSETQLRRLEHIQDGTLVVVLVTLLFEALGIFRPMVRRISRYAHQLLALATVDPLTGALNRRAFLERGTAAFSHARRQGLPLSVLMVDADHFKRVNDTHGHAAGDAVLAALATTLKHETRGIDLVGRLGGEEFGILLADADLARAKLTAERLRAAIAALRVESGGVLIRFTVSIGLAMEMAADATLDATLARADAALYVAKEGGRDRTECAA